MKNGLSRTENGCISVFAAVAVIALVLCINYFFAWVIIWALSQFVDGIPDGHVQRIAGAVILSILGMALKGVKS